MEYEERKIAKVYAIVTLYTIILLIGGILLGFAMGRQSVISEREIQTETIQVEWAKNFNIYIRGAKDYTEQSNSCKDSKIYSNALYSAISDIRGMQDFLEGKELRFKDHQMDKKGKLSSCVAYFV